ncbi:hypothetical protein BKN38_03155 [Helicobacter sp. CLO-3]|uniref:hypothetical protein n=1 Tax=unclassified Helicobacter TaxID=2593540 RepID=UPI000804E5BB|nr:MULTISPECIES: hypothetical protein [unclassified Helicobacter]OBV29289.1 hypothetical protein BA723_06075 [Helicobacter sp. CLO-3]OHU84462.1 hypothetical protein BKN38_03155 [Helicobacter sp. CLO-3]
MKIIHSVLMVFVLITFSACAKDAFDCSVKKREYSGLSEKKFRALLDKYGGTYVFDEKLKDEIRQRKEDKSEFFTQYIGKDIEVDGKIQKVTLGYIEKRFPETLSNGHKYFEVTFGISSKDYDIYLEKIREHIGDDEAFEKLKPYFKITQYHEDDKGNRFPITMETIAFMPTVKIGLFGDEGSGMKFCRKDFQEIPEGNGFYYLINDKFIKGERR